MLNNLKLKGNDLIVYATIYSFTNGTDDHCFHWSASYLAEWCWLQRRQVMRILKTLEENWYIERKTRTENWVKFVDYYTPYVKITQGGYVKITHHNNSSFDNDSSFNNTSIITWADAQDIQQPLDSLSPIGEQTPTPLTPRPRKQKRTDIDELIGEIKAVCNEYGIAYDKKYERDFAKHILDTKEYWAFCENIGQTRTQFAINVLIASIKINYFKGACSGPMKIYQNYADVYNQTAMKHNKQNSLVWYLPWLNITQWQN